MTDSQWEAAKRRVPPEVAARAQRIRDDQEIMLDIAAASERMTVKATPPGGWQRPGQGVAIGRVEDIPCPDAATARAMLRLSERVED